MSKDYSIDDILAEVDKKRGVEKPRVDTAELEDILPKKPVSVLDMGVTDILDTEKIRAAVGEPPLQKTPLEVEEKPEEPVRIKAEKPEKVKPEKPEKVKPEKIKPEKPEKVKKEKIKIKQEEPKTEDIVTFKKATVLPKPIIEETPPEIKQEAKPEPVKEAAPEPKPEPEPEIIPETTLPSNKGRAIQIGGDKKEEPPKNDKTGEFEFPSLESTQVLEPIGKEQEPEPEPDPVDEMLKKRGEALLERDLQLEQPLEIIDSLNPYDMLPAPELEPEVDDATNEKFISMLSGDTKSLADGELKELAEETAITTADTSEVVKTYIPSTPPPPPQEDAAAHLSEKAKRSNTALIESLNKALREKRASDVNAYRTLSTISPEVPEAAKNVKPVTHGLNIDYKKQILHDTSLSLSEHQPQLIEQKIKDLAGKRKRKIRDFVLEDIEDAKEAGANIAAADSGDEKDADFEDFDTSGQIWNDLCETHKGLKIRLIILLVLTGLACVLAFMNDLKIQRANVLGVDIRFFDKRLDVTNYLQFNLVLGVLGILTCTTVIKRGFAKLFTGKADCDSLCAIPAVAAVLSTVPLLSAEGFHQRDMNNFFIAAGLCGLLFNTIGKLMMMVRAKRNFRFISGDSTKYYAEIIKDEQVSRAFTKGVLYEMPILCSARKTEFLTDFLKNSYCNDRADQLCRYLAPGALAAAILVGLATMFLQNSNAELTGNISWALTTANATLCILSPFSIMFLVNFPLLRASKALSKSDAVVLGYNAAEKFSKVNSVLVDASALFPAGSVDFRNLKRCQHPNSLDNFAIDDAIITAASLAIESGSILTSMFYDMIAGKSELLYKIDNCIYEVNMGISGWLGNKRVMLGNREQMKHHGINVPDFKKERKYADRYGDVVYLAAGGETIAMFFLKIVPNPQIKAALQELQKHGVSVVVRTRDSLVTDRSLTEAFELEPEHIKVIPFDLHGAFDNCTKYASRGDGGVSCSGTFSSFAKAIITAKKITHSIILSSSSLFIGIFLAVILSVMFMAFANTPAETGRFSPTNVIMYNGVFFVLMMLMQGFKKYN